MKRKVFLVPILGALLLNFSCVDHDVIPEPDQFKSEDFVTGLMSPIAIAKGANNSLWVAEVGTGTGNDGLVSLIDSNGRKYPVIIGFLSVLGPEETPTGLSHMTVRDNVLYVLHGAAGKLYKFDLTGFVAGKSLPVKASELPSENIGQFVKNHQFKYDDNKSYLFDLTWGFSGDMFITDALANAVIRRKPDGQLSVFCEFPPYENTAAGSPKIDFLPTGIAYDGNKLLVSSLTGFPFPEGKATIQQLDGSANITPYKEGFNMLVDVVLTAANKPLAVELGRYSLTSSPPGYIPNSGRVLTENGKVLLEGLTMPTDIERTGDRTYHIVSMSLGKITKVTY